MLRVANIDVISRSFAKCRREIFRKIFSGAFSESLLTTSQVHLVPGTANINVIFRRLPLSRKEIDRKNFFKGFTGLLITNMTSAMDLGVHGAQGGKYRRHLQEFC